MTAQDDNPQLGNILQKTTGFDEIVHALVAVGDTLRHEENQALVSRQAESLAGFLLVTPIIYMCIYRIGDARDLMSLQQGTGLSLRLQPTATRHIIDTLIFEYLLFFFFFSAGQIIVGTRARQQPTITTTSSEVSAT